MVKLDDVLRVRVQIHRRVIELFAFPRTRIGLTVVGLLAGHHARLAPDAEGGVVEHSHRAGRGDLVLRRGGRGAAARGRCYSAGGDDLQQGSTVQGHVSPPSCRGPGPFSARLRRRSASWTPSTPPPRALRT